MIYDILFKCEKGAYTMEQCTNAITQRNIDEVIEILEDLGVGEVKEIVIKNIVLNNKRNEKKD